VTLSEPADTVQPNECATDTPLLVPAEAIAVEWKTADCRVRLSKSRIAESGSEARCRLRLAPEVIADKGERDGLRESVWSLTGLHGFRLYLEPHHGGPQITWCLTRHGGAAFGLAVIDLVGTR
jgi:hypothetical protein